MSEVPLGIGGARDCTGSCLYESERAFSASELSSNSTNGASASCWRHCGWQSMGNTIASRKERAAPSEFSAEDLSEPAEAGRETNSNCALADEPEADAADAVLPVPEAYDKW